jgi:DNA sulfur modification protein DndE
MAYDRVIFSEPAKENLIKLVRRFKLGANRDYVAARLALARSLASNQQPPLPEGPNSNKSILLPTLTRPYESLFRALITQRHQKQLSDAQYIDYLTAHIEHGLELMVKETEKEDADDYLVRLAREGLEQQGNKGKKTMEAPTVGQAFTGVLTLDLGEDVVTGKTVSVNFNKTDEHNNNYLAVVGKPGSGKTYFVKSLLRKIRYQSGNKINFVFFDYAKGDVAGDEKFVKDAGAKVICVPREPIPINPFWVSDPTMMSRKMTAQRLVETMKSFEGRLGPKQTQNMYNAIVAAYEKALYGPIAYPDIYGVNDELNAMYEELGINADSLTEVMRQLTEFRLFPEANDKRIWNHLYENTVIIDVHELIALRELTVFFVLDYLYRELMLLPDSLVDPKTQAREMRTIIVIDEAHHYLRDKKRSVILQKLIREIRSKGASVFLLSQSPDDYDQQDFDFIELLEFVFILQSSASSHHFLQEALGIKAEKAKALVAQVANLSRGEAITKDFPLKRGDYIQLRLR